jgi:hypothetical protein
MIFSNYNLEYLDLLKIDIEGGEKQLFESNYETGYPKRNVSLLNYMMEVLKEKLL